MDIIMDFFVEMFFEVYSELMFLIVPELRGNKKCMIAAMVIAVSVFAAVIALAVWGAVLISDYKNPYGLIPISAAAVISLAQIAAGIVLYIRNNK